MCLRKLRPGTPGRGAALLILALLGSACPKAGLFFLGIAPAIHPPWGAWCVGIAYISLACARLLTVENAKKHGVWFLAGALVTLCSLGYQLYIARHLPGVPSDVESEFFHASLRNIDIHRRTVAWMEPAVYLTVMSALFSLALLIFRKEDFAGYGRFMLWVFVTSGVVNMAGIALTHFPERVPNAIAILMPGRFINFNNFAFPALVLGLMGRYCHLAVVRALVYVHIAYIPWCWLVVPRFNDNPYGWRLEHWREFVLMGFLSLGWVFWTGRRGRWHGHPDRDSWAGSPCHFSHPRKTGRWRLSFTAAVAGCLIVAGLRTIPPLKKFYEYDPFRPYRNEVLVAASEGQGLLITVPGAILVQLMTRRPLLIDGSALDQISYFPASGALVNPALKRVYGVDFLTTPISALSGLEALWEARTLEEWQAIREEFGTTDVLALNTTELRLVETAKDHRLVLYHIPALGDAEGQDTAAGARLETGGQMGQNEAPPPQ